MYDKIDKGVRGCKVVISCVTSKYAISANCRREVSLADAVKKPIIPLLLEKTTWPPEGPMSLVFTHLLYIDCCKPNTDVQNEWNESQSQMVELRKKLTAYVPQMHATEAPANEPPKDEDGANAPQTPTQEANKSAPGENDGKMNSERKVVKMNSWTSKEQPGENKNASENKGDPVTKMDAWNNSNKDRDSKRNSEKPAALTNEKPEAPRAVKSSSCTVL